jgi:hypothetical protein
LESATDDKCGDYHPARSFLLRVSLIKGRINPLNQFSSTNIFHSVLRFFQPSAFIGV